MKIKDTHTNQENEAKQKFSKLLSEGKGKELFSVPAGYFENLSTNIQERIAKDERIPLFSRIIVHIKQPVWSVSLAGIAVLIFMAILFFPGSNNNPDLKTPTFTLEEILNSEPGIIYEMDESQLIEALAATNENEDISKPGQGIGTKSDSSFSDDDIIDYLLENDIDESIIYNL